MTTGGVKLLDAQNISVVEFRHGCLSSSFRNGISRKVHTYLLYQAAIAYFFPRIGVHTNIQKAAIPTNLALITRGPGSCWVYKFPEFKILGVYKGSGKYDLSDDGKLLAVSNNTKIDLFNVETTELISSYEGTLCGLDNNYLIYYSDKNIKTLCLKDKTLFNLEIEANSLNFNIDTLIVGYNENIQVYRNINNNWILFKGFVDKNNTNPNNSNYSISGSSDVIAITTSKDSDIENKVDQTVLIYTKTKESYTKQINLTFNSSNVHKDTIQLLQMSEDGRTLIWCNNNILEIFISDGYDWYRQNPIEFENKIDYISVDNLCRFCAVISDKKLFICN